MDSLYLKVHRVKELPESYVIILKELIKIINRSIQGKREIMYSDIINLIVREGYNGEIYNHLIIWCNFNIKSGNCIINPSL
jgi:hypothetical protein